MHFITSISNITRNSNKFISFLGDEEGTTKIKPKKKHKNTPKQTKAIIRSHVKVLMIMIIVIAMMRTAIVID
jgi:hypothetical protein